MRCGVRDNQRKHHRLDGVWVPPFELVNDVALRVISRIR